MINLHLRKSLFSHSDYDTKITEIETEENDIAGLVTKNHFNANVTKIKNKRPVISGLVTKTNFGSKF